MKKIGCIFGGTILGACIGSVYAAKQAKKRIRKEKDVSDKHLALYLMLYEWMKAKQNGKNMVSYLNDKEYKKIAIYGMSYTAELLIRELKESNIQIVYGMDKKVTGTFHGVDIYSPDEALPQADAVIVTAISFYESIAKELGLKMNCPIVSIEDIIFDLNSR